MIDEMEKLEEENGQLKARVAELEYVVDELRPRSPSQRSAQLDRLIARNSELEKRQDYQDRCEDELDWWRKAYSEEEPPTDMWESGQRSMTSELRARVAEFKSEREVIAAALGWTEDGGALLSEHAYEVNAGRGSAEARVAELDSQIHSVGLLMAQAAILLNDGAVFAEITGDSLQARVADAMRAHADRLSAVVPDQSEEGEG